MRLKPGSWRTIRLRPAWSTRPFHPYWGSSALQADPLTSREHILLSSIVLQSLAGRQDLTLETLISSVVSPPFDRIGVFPLESFYPQAKRMELAMQLNNILASPSFSGWMQGNR